jgi:hypothetical protein
METLERILAIGALIALLATNYIHKNEIAKLKERMNDPEYCIEQCSMAFEIMGC